MNICRTFFKRLAAMALGAVAAPMILPAATTYLRQWRKTDSGIFVGCDWGSISDCGVVCASPDELEAIFGSQSEQIEITPVLFRVDYLASLKPTTSLYDFLLSGKGDR